MSEEIYTKDEHYQDWKSDNLKDLIGEFLEVDEITSALYKAYGSGTGILFGIPSDLQSSVRVIVRLVLERQLEEKSDDFEAYCRQAFKDSD